MTLILDASLKGDPQKLALPRSYDLMYPKVVYIIYSFKIKKIGLKFFPNLIQMQCYIR